MLLPISPLPLLTTAIGLGGITVGLCSFWNLSLAAWIYGGSSSSSSSSSVPVTLSPSERRYLHALSARNLVAGLTVLAVTAYWQMQSGEYRSPEGQRAVQKALGLVISLGSVVPVCDAVVCLGWVGDWSENGRSGEVRMDREGAKPEQGVGNSRGKGSGEAEGKRVGISGRRKGAGTVHAARSVVWITGGLWCLLG